MITMEQGDCLDLMWLIPDQSVDMVLCDLPYGTTQNKWDVLIDWHDLWSHYERVCRGAIILTASQPFTSSAVMSKPDWFRYAWVWEKASATGHLNAKRMPMKLHEDVLVFSKTPAPYYPQGLVPYNKMARRGSNGGNFGLSGKENFQEHTNFPRSILRFGNDPKPMHPTQKPVALLEYLVKTYTQPGDTVLDNCMGSGSTGVACMNTGRKFIGFEKDKGHFDNAESRVWTAWGINQ